MDEGPTEIETPAAVNDLKPPPPVFDLMEAGSHTPERIEIKEGVVYQNGFKLEQEDADYLLHLIRTGRATIRYVKNDVDEKLAKMAAHFENLAKTAPEVRAAMGSLQGAVKSGCMPQNHADAIRRGLFTDRLTGGQIGNVAAHEDFLEGLKGQKDQGVHVHMDANDFGSINKMHGMPVGDQAIKTMARSMREVMDKHVGRKHGKLFRVGGDEFKAHFRTAAHASAFMRALHNHLDSLVPVGGTHRISLSSGIGHTPEHAEQALMNAKNEKKAQNYPVGQAEHHSHSLLPGQEGPVPLAASSVPKVRLQLR
jgi:GGDEF domain-containing protein